MQKKNLISTKRDFLLWVSVSFKFSHFFSSSCELKQVTNSCFKGRRRVGGEIRVRWKIALKYPHMRWGSTCKGETSVDLLWTKSFTCSFDTTARPRPSPKWDRLPSFHLWWGSRRTVANTQSRQGNLTPLPPSLLPKPIQAHSPLPMLFCRIRACGNYWKFVCYSLIYLYFAVSCFKLLKWTIFSNWFSTYRKLKFKCTNWDFSRSTKKGIFWKLIVPLTRQLKQKKNIFKLSV